MREALARPAEGARVVLRLANRSRFLLGKGGANQPALRQALPGFLGRFIGSFAGHPGAFGGVASEFG